MKGEFRLRVAYAKQGRGRWLSHLEVTRALGRTVRRSGLPLAVTRGFHPHLKLATGPALSVGIAALREYFDLYLTDYVPAMDALTYLQDAQAELLPISQAAYVNGSLPSLNAAIELQEICARIQSAGGDPRQLEAAFADLRTRERLEVEQKGKTKVFNPTVCIPKDAKAVRKDDTLSLEFCLRISQSGSLRPTALLAALSREMDFGAATWELERTGLFVIDDEGVWVAPL
ncbi:MAG: TIGR03936 family radical SAM-associated protein [Actinomycetes bacterium]|jgi:radical SAM-linked protein|nr:TIGR03936 family radical SAM-associated protein [Actinomycetes bacterium]